MDKLEPHKKDRHEGIELAEEQKQQFRFIGQAKKPFKNAKLYALDIEAREIYEVKIVKQEETAKIEGEDKYSVSGSAKAQINPDHPVLWALNDKNALRKFKQIKFKI